MSPAAVWGKCVASGVAKIGGEPKVWVVPRFNRYGGTTHVYYDLSKETMTP